MMPPTRTQAPDWVILASVPLVLEVVIPPGSDVSVGFTNPPDVSFVSVRGRVAPDVLQNPPFILAVNPSCRFLLYSSQGLTAESAVAVAREEGRHVDLEEGHHVEPVQREYTQGYFLCDPLNGVAFRVPDPACIGKQILCLGNVGFMANPNGNGDYMIAELRPVAGTDEATLLRYSTETARWEIMDVIGYGFDPPHPKWGCDGVVAHSGRLWWVDLNYGLFSCDPFDDLAYVVFYKIPRGCDKPFRVFVDLHRERCVRVSAGKLRYVQVDGSILETRKVGMWTLSNGLSTETWANEYEVPLAEIWADESYANTGMPRTSPVLAAVHPRNPAVLYFFLDKWIFAVDVPARKVVEFDVCKLQLLGLSADDLSSRYVHACELPREAAAPAPQPSDDESSAGHSHDAESSAGPSHDAESSDVQRI